VLRRRWSVEEVGPLAARLGAGRRIRDGTQVDLSRLSARIRAASPGLVPEIVVGHLAHLLPIRDAIVLRCHPVTLGRRLTQARRGSRSDRRANVEAEATDVVLLEALGLGRRVWEVDTTHRSVASVAREVAALAARRPLARYGSIDWLSDPRVTDYLLRLGR
jgi:adenylate kinase